MSQKPLKPVRQEYIAKIRYTNNLPPPPLNPKFLQYETINTSSKIESEQLMSSLFRKENFLNLIERLDDEYGMNLNLMNNTGFLEDGKESAVFGITNKDTVELHPKDRILLRDAGIGKISKSEPGVSFLRRTEYISDKQLPKTSTVENKNEKFNTKTHDPNAQLQAVEDTFNIAQESLSNYKNLKHPKKKHLKAVDAWPLLPDTSMLDTKFLTIRFTGSASINREFQAMKSRNKDMFDEEAQKTSLQSAIFKPITSDDGEWISLYKLEDGGKAAKLKEKLNSTEPEKPGNLLDEDEADEFTFKHFKNYDMVYQKFVKPNEELSIKFVPDESDRKKRKLAYYYPVNGKIELKKHRASNNSEINKFLDENIYDVINFKLREPTTNELKKMDAMRSEFDPMEYEGEEEEEIQQDDDENNSNKENERLNDVDIGEEFNQAEDEDIVNGN